MDQKKSCSKCEFQEDMKGCALKHIKEARKLLANGEYKGVDRQLSYIEEHLG